MSRGRAEQSTARARLSSSRWSWVTTSTRAWLMSCNRASEGLGLTSGGPGCVSPSDRGSEHALASRVSQLSVALRLTREAVYAWSNLLHGPAIVSRSLGNPASRHVLVDIHPRPKVESGLGSFFVDQARR